MKSTLSSTTTVQPGGTYRLVVRSAEEAVRTIREKLGEQAKVLSVRQLEGQGLAGLLGRPRLEVIAQVAPSTAEGEPAAEPADRVAEPEGARLTAEASAKTASAGEPIYRRRTSVEEPMMPLPELLRRSGFSEALLGRLQSSPLLAREGLPLHHSLAEVRRELHQVATARPRRPLPARSAFLGSPGVGRTTALCKWLAKEVMTQGRRGRVVKVEFDRPNPAEGLAVFCEALGLVLEQAAPSAGEPLGGAAAPFLYVDMPSLALRAPRQNAALGRFLDQEAITGRVLVLHALYDLSALRAAHAAARDLGATHLVFTHLDELEHWGKLWDFLLDSELTPLFFATGPSLSGDLEEDVLGAVLRKTLPGA